MYGNCNCIFQNKFSVVSVYVILYELPVDGVHFYLLPARRLSAIGYKREGRLLFFWGSDAYNYRKNTIEI